MENSIKKWILYLYSFGMLIVYPLIMHNMYFDLTDTKLITFYVITALLILAVFIYIFLFGVKLLDLKKELIFLCVAIADIIISFVINGHSGEMLVSDIEYGTGVVFLVTLGLGCGAILMISDVDISMVFSYIAASSSILVGLFTLLQFCGVDIGGMISRIQEDERFLFLGPLGNVANLGFYAVMIIPFCCYCVTVKDRLVLQILGGLGVYLACITCLVSNTDGSILALAVVVLLIGLLLCKDLDSSLYFYILVGLIALALATIWIIVRFDSAVRILDVHQNVLASPAVFIPLFGVSLVGILVRCFVKGQADSIICKIIRLACAVCIVMICLLPVAIIVYTNSHQTAGDSLLGSLLFFDIRWGTDRGYLWRSGVKIFSSGSFLQMLFGRCAGGFSNAYFESYYAKSIELGLYSNYDAHNVFLQFLCEYGLVGLVSVIGLIVLRLRAFWGDDRLFFKFKAISLVGAMVASFFFVFQNVTLAWLPLLI